MYYILGRYRLTYNRIGPLGPTCVNLIPLTIYIYL